MQGSHYFSHDTDARHDYKIQALLAEHGPEGYGVYWMLVEILHNEPEHRIPIAMLSNPGFARSLFISVDKLQAIAYTCFDLLLFARVCLPLLEVLESASVNRRVEQRKALSKRRSEAGKKGGKINRFQAIAKQTEAIAKQSQANTTNENVNVNENVNEKEKEARAGVGKLLLPPGWNTQELRAAVAVWRQNLQQNHKRTFSQIDLDALLMSYNGRSPGELAQDLAYSATSRWKTVHEKPLSEKERVEISSTTRIQAAQKAQERPRPAPYVPPPTEALSEEQRQAGVSLLKSLKLGRAD